MPSVEFMSRIIGMVFFALVGARLGIDAASAFNLPEAEEAFWFSFSLLGFLIGLVITPYITIRPIQRISQSINEMPIESLFMALIGLFIGLSFALLMAYPLSFIGSPWNAIVPPAISVIGGYLGATIFRVRSREILDLLSERFNIKQTRLLSMQSNRKLLIDTSVLIDGRIVEITKTGFVGGTILIPRFVMTELHQVADSADTLRRKRGRRGLNKLNELQRNNVVPVKIIDDDIEDIIEVDDKLVALAQQMDAALITNDYPLSKVAEGQGVLVLNMNSLSNAVRSVYIPGESFPLHIIQEGTDANQGVGYLDDGTMVVVENGRTYMDRTIKVEVTRMITRDTGRILFAIPENEKER